MPARLIVAVVVSLAPLPAGGAEGLVMDHGSEDRIDALLSQMTLEEKVGQLNQVSDAFDPTGPAPTSGRPKAVYDDIRQGRVGSMLNVSGAEATRALQRLAVENSRLGIPMLFGLDVIHGYRTIFPVPLGEAASWDLAVIERSARVAATEAAAAGLHWTFAPMVDVSRDPRWGRVMEGAGEDPYLGARVAAARVRGFQGERLGATDAVAACAKHYAGYGFVEAGRDYNTVDMSEQTLRDVVLPPFRAAADAGVATFMSAYNEIGGMPAAGNRHLVREILKGEWGFGGLVVSDWATIAELVTHGVAENLEEATLRAIVAGTDVDMASGGYVTHLAALVRAGRVDETLVDDAVRRVLRLKLALGLLDDPYRYSDVARERRVLFDPSHAAAAREVARESFVLLRNEGGLLPLDPHTRSIAVIGPLAADADSPLGNWRARAAPGSAVSLVEGIRAAVSPGVKVVHAPGVRLAVGPREFGASLTIDVADRSGIPAAVKAARQADVVIAAVGEDAFQSGEGRSQAELGLAGLQDELLRSVIGVNPRTVVVLMSGRPLVLGWVAERAPAILEVWHAGSQAGHAIADVLFGRSSPSGKLPIAFPRSVGQLPMTYAHKNTGRPGPGAGVFWSRYSDVPNEPRYPFGFGLTYTTFTYSQPRLDARELGRDGSLRVSTTITNTGKRPGAEVVQLYVRDLVGSLTRPVKELKGFEKVTLAPGEARVVTFTLSARDLAFYTAAGRFEPEPGAFEVFVGTSSTDLESARFVLR